ncbi:hypothetical protein [Sinomonas flava]|uniref:Uncharacterized protein n=1 Tax=Sinomonas flava TaxID=496857 RepID=A0ABP5NHG3_9MICC
MDFAARITTAAPGTEGEAAPTDPRSTGIVPDVDAEAEGAATEDLDRLVREVVDPAVIVRMVRASADVRLASVVVRTTPPAP